MKSIRRSKIKNAGLLKKQKCINNNFNVVDIDSLILILDQFLQSNQNNEQKSNQLINKLYNLLDTVIHAKNKLKYYDENWLSKSITMGKKIGGGSYGSIHSCFIKKKKYVVKIPIYKKNNKKEVDIEFLKEIIMHVFLYCFHDLMNKCFKISQVDRFVPEIIDVVKTTNEKHKNEKLIVIMEKLDSDGEKFFEKKKPYKDELKFIALVAYNIYFLQKSIKQFMHRDLHAKNVMLKKTKSTTKIVVHDGKDKFNFNIESNYKMYFIDFGMSCFDLSSCLKTLDMPVSKMSSLGGGYDTNNYCDNRSHDLRLFLSSIYKSGYPLSDNLNNWLGELFEAYELQDLKEEGEYFFHGMYEQVLKKKDPNFYPENILKKISQELNDLS